MIRSILLAGAALCAGLCADLSGAEAHAFLDRADPGVGATIKATPATVTLTFTEGLEPAFSSITVQGADGQRFDQGSAHTVDGDPTRFAVDVKPLPPGTYKVLWRATSVDTHKTNGDYSFTVAP